MFLPLFVFVATPCFQTARLRYKILIAKPRGISSRIFSMNILQKCSSIVFFFFCCRSRPTPASDVPHIKHTLDGLSFPNLPRQTCHHRLCSTSTVEATSLLSAWGACGNHRLDIQKKKNGWNYYSASRVGVGKGSVSSPFFCFVVSTSNPGRSRAWVSLTPVNDGYWHPDNTTYKNWRYYRLDTRTHLSKRPLR